MGQGSGSSSPPKEGTGRKPRWHLGEREPQRKGPGVTWPEQNERGMEATEPGPILPPLPVASGESLPWLSSHGLPGWPQGRRWQPQRGRVKAGVASASPPASASAVHKSRLPNEVPCSLKELQGPLLLSRVRPREITAVRHRRGERALALLL